MLPDFPKIKNKIKKTLIEYMEHTINSDPFHRMIRKKRHFEGNKFSIGTVNGEIDESEYKEIGSRFEIKEDEIVEKGIEAIKEKVKQMAIDIKKTMEQDIFEKLDDITKKTGNVVEGKGQPFSQENYIEVIKKLSLDFNEKGDPILPAIVVNPQMVPEIKEKMIQWENDLEFKKKLDELYKQKKKDWDDRESNRKLVD